MVGTGRFELPTPRTPSECSTRLSHVPTGRNPRSRSAADRVDSEILSLTPEFSEETLPTPPRNLFLAFTRSVRRSLPAALPTFYKSFAQHC